MFGATLGGPAGACIGATLGASPTPFATPSTSGRDASYVSSVLGTHNGSNMNFLHQQWANVWDAKLRNIRGLRTRLVMSWPQSTCWTCCHRLRACLLNVAVDVFWYVPLKWPVSLDPEHHHLLQGYWARQTLAPGGVGTLCGGCPFMPHRGVELPELHAACSNLLFLLLPPL